MSRSLTRIFLRFFAAFAVIGLSACSAHDSDANSAQTTAQAPLTVFLVRHAEKMTGDDPDLTAEGQLRAEALADMLIDAKIETIHSSDYARTRQTAAPLAEQLGLTVQSYDPRDLPGMAAALKAAGGRHLVVGHSNTTGELAEYLGGDGGAPIVEATEYDRLYVVTVGANGGASTTLLRYGAASPR